MLNLDLDSFDAVIFDFDGTLYDFRGLPQRLVMGSPLNMFKMSAERKARRILKGQDLGCEAAYDKAFAEEMVKHRFLGLGVSTERILRWYKRFYLSHMVRVLRRHYEAREGVAELFSRLKSAGKKIAVLSDYPMVRERMKAIGLADVPVDILAAASDYGALKPAVRPMCDIAEKLNVSQGRCLVVGDRRDTDGEAARRAGMPFVQIRTHKNGDESGVVCWAEFASAICA